MFGLLAVTTALVLGAAACGSSGSSSASGSGQSSSTTAAAPTGAPINVGLICTCSGPFGAAFSPGSDAYQAWVKTVNASGGINGHPINLIFQDDAMNPGTSVSAIHTLLSDNIVALVDNSLLDRAWNSTVTAANIPIIAGEEGTTTPVAGAFIQGTTADTSNAQTVYVAKQAHATKIGDLYCAESPACASTVQGLKAGAAQAGIPVAYSGTIAVSAPNYTAQCVAAQQAGVDFLTVGSQPSTVERVVGDCAKQGYNPALDIGGALYSSGMASLPGFGGTIWQTYPNLPFWVSSNSQIKAMNSAMAKYYPSDMSQAATPGEIIVQGWASGLLLQDALKTAGLKSSDTPTPALVLKGLYALHGDTLGGLAPALTFAQGQPSMIECWFTARVDKGKPTLLNNGKTTCANGSSGT